MHERSRSARENGYYDGEWFLSPDLIYKDSSPFGVSDDRQRAVLMLDEIRARWPSLKVGDQSIQRFVNTT